MRALTIAVRAWQIRKAMEAAEKEHRENLNEMEFKFFKEKVTSRV